jgi:glycosyltransferase involved in cell wall biosynthesis
MICDYYLPGFESGGAMRTLVNMVDRLHDEFDFKVITRNHDGPNNLKPYTTVKIGAWNRVGIADVYYLSRQDIRRSTLERLIAETTPDVIYVNSFFSALTVSVLWLKRFGKLGELPVVLAPEGELIPKGGLNLKPAKKRLYITVAKLLHLLDVVVWKAAAEIEREDILRVFPDAKSIFIAPNLPPAAEQGISTSSNPRKDPGSVKLVFLSRFMRKKNLNWFLELLPRVSGEINLDVYGPIEDDQYFEETKQIVKNLPANVKVEFKGAVDNVRVPRVLGGYHFFVLPTLGENFGHIFVEAMNAGLPLIISDRSPWRDLEGEQVGWDMPIEDGEDWIKVIAGCVQMAEDEYRNRSNAARSFARQWLEDPALDESNRAVLRHALERAG